jgi:hypothetical protein
LYNFSLLAPPIFNSFFTFHFSLFTFHFSFFTVMLPLQGEVPPIVIFPGHFPGLGYIRPSACFRSHALKGLYILAQWQRLGFKKIIFEKRSVRAA